MTPHTLNNPSPLGRKAPAESPVAQARLRYIDTLSAIDMAILFRFAPPGHPFFDVERQESVRFAARFEKLGGMTPTLSKSVGLAAAQFTKNVVDKSLHLYPEFAEKTPRRAYELDR